MPFSTTFATLGGDSNWHTDDEIEADSSLLEIHCDAPEIDKSSTPPQYEFEPGMCYSNPRYCWVQMLNGLPKYNCRPDWGPPSPCKRNAQPEPVEMQIEARDAGAEAEADDDSFDTIQKRCNYFNQNWKNRCCEHQVLVKATSPCHAPKDPCLWFARARLGTVL